MEDEIKVENLNFSDIEFETKDITPAPAPETVARTSAQVTEINALKKDLNKMAGALRESMRLSQDSFGEIEKLTGFLKTAEVTALSVDRLVPENAGLKTKLENVNSELSKKTLWASELESRSIAYKARFEETHDELEAARAKLVKVEDKLRDESSKRNEGDALIDKLQSERRDLLVIIDDLRAENTAVRDEMQNLREAELTLTRRNTELVKEAETLTAQIDDERRDKELAVSDLKNLRLDYSELKADQIETLSKLDKARHEVASGQQTLGEFRARSDDKIFALSSTIEGLKAQQKINEDMNRYDTIEKAKLKTDMERERRRSDELKNRLDDTNKEMQTNRTALAQAKANYEVLNDKFLRALSDIENLRRDHDQQAKKLEEYSSISGVAVGQSFYDDRSRDQRTGQTIRGDGAIPNLKLVTEPKTKKDIRKTIKLLNQNR